MTFLVVLGAVLVLGFLGAPLWAWFVGFAGLLLTWNAPFWLYPTLAVPGSVFLFPILRKPLISGPLLRWIQRKNLLPVISDTEREALEAGTVWYEGDLFSGNPDFKRLVSTDYPELSKEEYAFYHGPVEEVCKMTDDWKVFQKRDLSPEVHQFLKDKGFYGMNISPDYGGKGFTPSGISAVISKLSSRSIPLGITAMLPNSLGPAELIQHWGTEEQKAKWLPRLATGREVPCFALTEPEAGSDASSISSRGVVYCDEGGNLCIRLDWDKRYTTMALRATVIGLAFQLEDPEGLLGKGASPGITVALVPADADGIERGLQHDPLNVPFFNSPFRGHGVEVPLDAIIGGVEGAGKGWQMLMECLAAGRGIMLPAQGSAVIKGMARVASAYSAIRRQFGQPIGKFQGVREPLARLAGDAYTFEAARRFTCGALDAGEKPAVASAIAKYQFTEAGRRAANDAMDILGGAGISRGPRNLVAHPYFNAPISITVEGANILTRSLMIFGQGAVRCHPYAWDEIEGVKKGDEAQFDKAFFGHIGHVIRNICRTKLLYLTRGRLATVPHAGPLKRDFQRLAWSSATFALLADLAMVFHGGGLKRKESLTGRFADAFSWMYLAAAVLRRFGAEGRLADDLPLARWALDNAFVHVQRAIDGIYRNFGTPILGLVLRWPVSWLHRANPIGSPPPDSLAEKVAGILTTPGGQRDRLTAEGLFIPGEREEALARLEEAFQLCFEAERVAEKLKEAVRDEKLPKGKVLSLLEPAVAAGILIEEEADLVRRAEKARADAILVDAFAENEYHATSEGGGWAAD